MNCAKERLNRERHHPNLAGLKCFLESPKNGQNLGKWQFWAVFGKTASLRDITGILIDRRGAWMPFPSDGRKDSRTVKWRTGRYGFSAGFALVMLLGV